MDVSNETSKFLVELNEQTKQIHVKTNDLKIVGEGYFAVDKPDRTVLILFHHIQMPPNNSEELSQFLTVVTAHVGKLYKAFVWVRLPAIYDGRMDLTKLEFQTQVPNLMAVTLDHLNYFPDNNTVDQFELVTDKETILKYAEDVLKLMHREGFWAKFWTLEENCHRINSATHPAIIIEKTTNKPVGFGRLFLLETNEEVFGYLSDIAIDSAYQSKGLGRMIVNYFVGLCANQDFKQRSITGTLCLQCADTGSGAISAPKLYKRSGFETIKEIDNRIAIFAEKQFYAKPSTE